MQYTYMFILLVAITIAETISASDFISDDRNEEKFDEIRHITLPAPPSRKLANMPECLSKNQLQNMLNRDRRASISRPYFHHWRPARDSTRYAAKTSLAFSPRLGKRSYEDDHNSDENENNVASRSADLDTFLATLASHLQGMKVDIVYEDPTKICLTQSISDTLIQQVADKADASRRDQEAQEREEARPRQPAAKHPVLFRYRLG